MQVILGGAEGGRRRHPWGYVGDLGRFDAGGATRVVRSVGRASSIRFAASRCTRRRGEMSVRRERYGRCDSGGQGMEDDAQCDAGCRDDCYSRRPFIDGDGAYFYARF